MGNCSSLLPPSLGIFGTLLLQTSSVTSSSPAICAHLEPQRETVWNMKLNGLTCAAVELPYLCHGEERRGPRRPSLPSRPRSARELGAQPVYVSQCMIRTTPRLAGGAVLWDTLTRAGVVQGFQCRWTSILVFPKTKGSFEKPRLEMFGTNVKLMTFGALSSI